MEWVRALLRFERAALHVDWSTALCGYGFAVVLLWGYIRRGEVLSNILLLAYWALLLPNLAQEMVLAARQLPGFRSTARRLLEPVAALGTGETETAAPPSPKAEKGGVELRFEQVQAVAAGRVPR